MLISSVICEGKQSFNPPSTPSQLTFVHPPLFLPPPPPPSPPQFARNHTQQPDHEPLPSIEGCGLDDQRLCSLTSKDAAPGAPPLSQGMWVVQTHSTEDPRREEDQGGTHEVGSPGAGLQNMNHDSCHGLFSTSMG